MNQANSRWMPPSGTRDHTGAALSQESIFFAPPPPEIGHVVSAHSGVYRGGSAMNRPAAQRVVGLFTVFGILVGGFLGACVSGGNWVGTGLGAVFGALVIGGLIYRREGRKRDCTYVGTFGIARCKYPGSAPPEILLFANASELQTAFLGRNMGTNFNFQWKDVRGKTLYKLEGGYYGTTRKPDPESVYHFAASAERAWTNFLWPQAMAEMNGQGSCRFIINRSFGQFQYASVSPGLLEFTYANRQFQLRTQDIEDVVVHNGIIMIRRHGAQEGHVPSRAGEKGIFYISYGVVSNVQLFFRLIERLLGVTCRESG